MSYLYVNENGAVLSHSDNCFKVSCKDGVVRSIPSETLDGVSLFGTVQVTTQCIEECLRKGINIISTLRTDRISGASYQQDMSMPSDRKNRRVCLMTKDSSLHFQRR